LSREIGGIFRAVANSLVAACGSRKEGGSEDTSRSSKGLALSALLQARVVFPLLQQPWRDFRSRRKKHGTLVFSSDVYWYCDNWLSSRHQHPLFLVLPEHDTIVPLLQDY
jgi:hypothetical protein